MTEEDQKIMWSGLAKGAGFALAYIFALIGFMQVLHWVLYGIHQLCS